MINKAPKSYFGLILMLIHLSTGQRAEPLLFLVYGNDMYVDLKNYLKLVTFYEKRDIFTDTRSIACIAKEQIGRYGAHCKHIVHSE